MRSLSLVLNAAVAAVVATAATAALAHAKLQDASPAKEAVVAALPEAVVLHFSEPVEAGLSSIEVRDLSSKAVVSDGPVTGPGDQRSLQVHLTPPTGAAKKTTFRVTWKAVAKDTHRTNGSYDFVFDPGTSGK